jgi:hypothetical protein
MGVVYGNYILSWKLIIRCIICTGESTEFPFDIDTDVMKLSCPRLFDRTCNVTEYVTR